MVKGKVLVALVVGRIGKGTMRTLWSTYVIECMFDYVSSVPYSSQLEEDKMYSFVKDIKHYASNAKG